MAESLIDGTKLLVRQEERGSRLFVDGGGKQYTAQDLDFTQPTLNEQNNVHFDALKEMMANMDVKAQDDHRADIAEREYWRKLRGDIFMEVFKTADETATVEYMIATTEKYFTAIYNQDKEFFKD